jgi:hypothetical protein
MLPPAEIMSVALGAGAVGTVIGVLAGITMSRGARRAELRDFWQRGYAFAEGLRTSKPVGFDHDAMAEPFGDVTLVPEAHRHG